MTTTPRMRGEDAKLLIQERMAKTKMSKMFHYYIDLMRKSQRGHIKVVIEKDFNVMLLW